MGEGGKEGGEKRTAASQGLVAVGLCFEDHPLPGKAALVEHVVLVDLVEVEVCGCEGGEEEEGREEGLHFENCYAR